MLTLPKGQTLSNLIVATFICLWLIYFSYLHGGVVGRPILFLVALYEGYTIINTFPNDTLSESVWRLTRGRPFIPWIFGYATAYAIFAGTLADPHLAVAVGFLQGHFFFQRYQEVDAAA